MIPHSPRAFHFSLTDRITLAYLISVPVYVLAMGAPSDITLQIAAVHIVFISAILLFAKNVSSNSHPAFQFSRAWYPVVMFVYFYPTLGYINRLLFHDFLDDRLIALETSLFGFEPAMYLPIEFNSQFLVEYFHLTYFLYYLYLPIVGLILYFSRRELFCQFIFTVSFSFYCCYWAFLLFPATGPIPLRAGVYSGFFPSLMELVYKMDMPGQAFPSSHVAIGIVVAIFALRHSKLFGLIMLPLVASLAAATVYCRYHYAVDMLAGIAVAPILVTVADSLYSRYANRHGRSGA